MLSHFGKLDILVNNAAELMPASFEEEDLQKFGQNTLLRRPGQLWEVATCFMFLASRDSSYITGQTLHPNGGGHISG